MSWRVRWCFVVALIVFWGVGCGGPETNTCENVTCSAGQQCVNGACVSGCKTEETDCSGSCVDTKSDPKNCGGCGTACKSGESCSDGACKAGCDNGKTSCSGSCVDTQTDAKNCGECGKACKSGESCSDGVCKAGCDSGKTDCSGSCVDTKSDPKNCGGCGTACKSGESCSDGACKAGCDSGKTDCSGSCVDTQTDAKNCGGCGTTCKDTETCKAGKCESNCKSGETDCSGSCVDTQTDAKNCGGCGTACKTTEVCNAGKCESSCKSGETDCSGSCVDTQTDLANCGACGKACTRGQSCTKGVCACKAGLTDCSGTCSNLNMDKANCGACGTACQAGEICSESKCIKLEKYLASGKNGKTGSVIHTYAVTADSAGNAYITGGFATSIVFGTTTLSSKGSFDLFVAKVDTSGQWVWAVRYGEALSEIGRAIALDSQGNVYVAGQEFAATYNQTKGSTDIMVYKLDPSGNRLWRRFAGGSGSDTAFGLAVDGQDNVIMSGHFVPTGNFGPTKFYGPGNNEIVVAKLDSQGNWLWARQAGGSGGDNNAGLAVDKAGHVYITGNFAGTSTFGSTTLSSKGKSDVYVAKLSAWGEWQWAVSGGGAEDDKGASIAVSGAGDVYVSGEAAGPSNLGSTTLTGSGSHLFVAKLSNAGAWLWAKQAVNAIRGDGISVDPAGNAFVTGQYINTVSFGSTTLTSKGDSDFYLAKLDNTGTWLYALSGGGAGADVSSGVFADVHGNAYITGTVKDSASFEGATFGSGANVYHSFVARILATDCPQSCPSGSTCCSGSCVKVETDANNCSACGLSCEVGGSCSSKQCSCPSGTTACSDSCADTQTSSLHCGACGKACSGGQLCKAGACVCPDALSFCGGACLDVQENNKHCGACGKTCKAGEGCNSGTCVPNWATQGFADNGLDSGYAIVADSAGNLYVTGTYQSGSPSAAGSLTFGTEKAKGYGSSDIFVAKFDKAGKPLKLAVMGGKSSDYGYAIALDASDNVYITGIYDFGRSSTEGPGTFGSLTLTGRGRNNIFVAKLDKDLKVLKADVYSGPKTAKGTGIDVDGSGNVYVTGYFNIEIQVGTTTLTSQSQEDVFVAKLDKDLKVLTTLHGKSQGSVESHGLDVDSTGSVYVVGNYAASSPITFGNASPTSAKAIGSNDLFVAKLDKDLKLLKFVNAGGTGSDSCTGVTSDGKGSVYITGSFNGGSGNQGTFGSTTLTGQGGNDLFVAKLDKDLNWTKAVSGGSDGNDEGLSLALDSGNNVYVAGISRGIPVFTYGTATVTGRGGDDILFAQLDKDLTWLRVQRGASTDADTGEGIAVSGSDFFLTGSFTSSFSAKGRTLNDKKGFSEIFVVKNLP